MLKKLYYGIDLHASQITGHLIKKGENLERENFKVYTNQIKNEFIPKLTKESYVCVEASTCTYKFVKMIEEYVKEVIIVNPIAFKELYCTGKKTDKVDARKLANRLKYYVESDDEDGDFPVVYLPEEHVISLRKLFSTYKLLNKDMTGLKNRVHSILKSNLLFYKRDNLFKKDIKSRIESFEIEEIDRFQIELILEQIEKLKEHIEKIKNKILEIGYKYFEEEIKLLISIKGISDFIACAIMSDICDIKRFKNYKKLCSYLRSAPKVDSSNEIKRNGRINKKGRKLSFELLLQGINHIIKSTPRFSEFYLRKTSGKGKNKIRSAIVRKTIVAIYYILKNKEIYRDYDHKNYEIKIKQFEKNKKIFSQTA